jgi:mannose-1-phosphate guanylyltransferase
MAGGEGTRLWPLSRRKRPKQVLRLYGDRTLFQMAVDRLLPLLEPDQIYVVAGEEHVDALKAQAPVLRGQNFIIEPAPRGTASVIGLGASLLRIQDPQATLACLTADHFIKNEGAFRGLLRSGFELAERGELVTLGITPTFAASGFGYIEMGHSLGDAGGRPAYRALSFKEKPAPATAVEYLDQGRYVWNSGMFIWQAGRILEEIGRLVPDLAQSLRAIEQAVGTDGFRQVYRQVWESLQRRTIDYAVMEGADNVVVLPADDLGWWDVGGWHNLFEILEPDVNGNITLGSSGPMLDTKGVLVFLDEALRGRRLVATLGIEDLVIVETEDVLLVCRRQDAERVREIVAILRDSGQDQYL